MTLRRREFITFLGGAAAWPLAAGAQQPAMPVIGYLNATSPNAYPHLIIAFHQGLNEVGYVEHRNVGFDYRWAEGQYDRLPALASDLVRRQVAVIATSGGDASTLAAKAATSTIPIVFSLGSDPVQLGIVSNLARPDGNLTGIGSWVIRLGPKRLELLRELVPRKLIGVLVNPNNPTTQMQVQELQEAAHSLGLRLHFDRAGNEREIDAAFATIVEQRPGALLIGADPFFTSRRNQIVALAAHHRLPTIYGRREYAAAGGLLSYDSNLVEVYRLLGTYTGRILKGDKPSDLPVQQASKIELVINLKTARALGIDVPLTLRARADEVIE
jgi:putative ABC transport system substrate-binding protein